MFSFFKKDPIKAARKRYQDKLEQGMNAQRNGDMRLFASLSEEAEALRIKLETLEQAVK